MGTKIEMVSTVPLPGIKTIRGTLWLSKKAAKLCLAEAGIDPKELELIIFAGMYRDKHIGEPSIASLLQKEIGANPHLFPLDKRTFSFDVNTGGCGILNAIEIMDGFITTGQLSTGMIITGDSEPFKGLSESYNFIPSASALILSKSEGNEDFKMIRNFSYPQYLNSFRSYISWKKRIGRRKNRNILVLEQSNTYLQECVDCSIESLHSFLNEAGLSIQDIDFLIPSQSPAGFPAELEMALDNSVNVIKTNGNRGELHTSGPSVALKRIFQEKEYINAKNILFLTVGAGINNVIAWYGK